LPSDAEKDLITELEEHRFKDTYRDRPFVYHAQLLEVLIGTIKGAESFNMSKAKLKGIFSLGYLLETLANPDSLVSSDGPNVIIDNPDKGQTMDIRTLNNLRNAIDIFSKSNSLNEKNESKPIGEEAIRNRMKGFSIIKNKLAEFAIELYLNANTKMNEEISSNLNSFHILLEKEIRRLESLTNLTDLSKEFFNYFFGPFLTILHAYTSRFLSNEKRASDFLSGRSETPFYKFLTTLLNSLPLFKGKLSQQHVDNLKRFLQICTNGLEENDQRNIEVLLGDEFDNDEEEFKNDKRKRNINIDQENSEREDLWATRENWNLVMKVVTHNNLNFQEVKNNES